MHRYTAACLLLATAADAATFEIVDDAFGSSDETVHLKVLRNTATGEYIEVVPELGGKTEALVLQTPRGDLREAAPRRIRGAGTFNRFEAQPSVRHCRGADPNQPALQRLAARPERYEQRGAARVHRERGRRHLRRAAAVEGAADRDEPRLRGRAEEGSDARQRPPQPDQLTRQLHNAPRDCPWPRPRWEAGRRLRRQRQRLLLPMERRRRGRQRPRKALSRQSSHRERIIKRWLLLLLLGRAAE